jgi:3'-phosphoadenosine 5'-phosphosulfate sulfotransferase (PAPS reductase)/FAD synthetase
MLHEILKAWDGKLPEDVHVCFANTGKEREETLRFVHECSSRWDVRVHWLEYRNDGCGAGFEEVGFNSASRNGEPFAAVIAQRRFLPNAVTRYCTAELKVRTMARFARSLGWERWVNAIGLRYDEGYRILKALDRDAAGKERWRTVMPLSAAKITKRDILAFWAEQPFDLGLRHYEGNCTLCFLKGRAKLLAIMRENPGVADWWIKQERSVPALTPDGARFVTEYSYADLAREVREQGHLFDGFVDDGEEHDAECGLTCAGD